MKREQKMLSSSKKSARIQGQHALQSKATYVKAHNQNYVLASHNIVVDYRCTFIYHTFREGNRLVVHGSFLDVGNM